MDVPAGKTVYTCMLNKRAGISVIKHFVPQISDRNENLKK
jgi:hypothetical protein